VKDELARLKHLPRVQDQASGMDNRRRPKDGGWRREGRRALIAAARQPTRRLKIGATVVVKADPQRARLTRLRTSWSGLEPESAGDAISPRTWEPRTARRSSRLSIRICRGYGPNLHRLALTLHFSGQSLASDRRASQWHGVVISKRQVVRLLTANWKRFARG